MADSSSTIIRGEYPFPTEQLSEEPESFIDSSAAGGLNKMRTPYYSYHVDKTIKHVSFCFSACE